MFPNIFEKSKEGFAFLKFVVCRWAHLSLFGRINIRTVLKSYKMYLNEILVPSTFFLLDRFFCVEKRSITSNIADKLSIYIYTSYSENEKNLYDRWIHKFYSCIYYSRNRQRKPLLTHSRYKRNR